MLQDYIDMLRSQWWKYDFLTGKPLKTFFFYKCQNLEGAWCGAMPRKKTAQNSSKMAWNFFESFLKTPANQGVELPFLCMHFQKKTFFEKFIWVDRNVQGAKINVSKIFFVVLKFNFIHHITILNLIITQHVLSHISTLTLNCVLLFLNWWVIDLFENHYSSISK